VCLSLPIRGKNLWEVMGCEYIPALVSSPVTRSRKPPATSPTRAVGYVRVSTEEQHLGPAAQRKALVSWCAGHGVELVAVHEDLGVSGGAELEKRPGLMAALDGLATHGAGVLLVGKRDRLARDVVLAAMIERLAVRAGARVLAADGNGNGNGPEGELMRGIVDVFAAYERALIRSRTKAALAVKRARGERVGEIPYGARLGADGIRLDPAPAELGVIKRVRQLRAAGLTIEAIATKLNAEGHPARGNRWHPTTVSRLLRRAV
jgi:site-specific DNA recombinase